MIIFCPISGKILRIEQVNYIIRVICVRIILKCEIRIESINGVVVTFVCCSEGFVEFLRLINKLLINLIQVVELLGSNIQVIRLHRVDICSKILVVCHVREF